MEYKVRLKLNNISKEKKDKKMTPQLTNTRDQGAFAYGV